MYKNNAQAISKALDKIKKGELLVEEILDDEDLVNDLKSPSFSQLISFINTEKMEELLNFILKEPEPDCDREYGHKYPYFACEILCSENVFLLEKYFEDANRVERKDSDIEVEIQQDENSYEEDKKEKLNQVEAVVEDVVEEDNKDNKDSVAQELKCN